MSYRETGIIEVVCEAADGSKVVYRNSKKMQPYLIPSGYREISYYSEKNCKKYEVSLLRKYKENDAPIESDEEKVKADEIRRSGIEFEFEDTMPKAIYTDITDSEMFGFPEISKNVLTSPDNGLWAYHGIRKLKFILTDLAERDDNWEITAVLYFDRKDNDQIPEIRMEDMRIARKCGGEREYELYAFVDTNKLGKEFDHEKHTRLFSGFLEVNFRSKDRESNDIVYAFPVELLLNNTYYNTEKVSCRPLQRKVVSIDFGTSSSCVAVEGENGIELLTLSATEEGRDNINIYENPTCVMIYRWKEIYEQWRKENENFPFILKGDLDEEEREEKEVQFDFGYSVKECLNEVSDKELNAIITEIKMIPKMMSEDIQLTVRPLIHQDKKTIRLVDSYEQQDDEKLDVVALYGYILGRAINRVEKNKIYTRFQITYPVKFNDRVRKKLCASLEYGLKRSIPLPLRDAVDGKGKPVFRIETKYPEPVAYIGSVCGKYLTIDSYNPVARPFAVYDFGGGTLDYSFGIFAQDPEDVNSSNIYILGVDGDSDMGGELLIRKLSYWVYTSPTNVKEFVDKKIPFEKPSGELLPDNCPEILFNQTASAKSNVRKMNERVTRGIFENRGSSERNRSINYPAGDDLPIMVPQGAKKNAAAKEKDAVASDSQYLGGQSTGTEIVDFLDLDDREVTIEVSYDEKELNNKLESLLDNTVQNFKESMQRTFESKKGALEACGIMDFQLKDVCIFKAGNSSRNKILEGIMEREFSENEILLVDETSDEFMSTQRNKEGDILESRPKQVALTPKTAVAFGQLKLSDYFVDESYIQKGESNAPFNWYIGAINRGNNAFEMLIDKVNPEKGWVRYGRINSEETRIYYSETLIRDADDTKLKSVLLDEIDESDIHKYLYIRVQDADEICYCVCAKGETVEEVSKISYVSL